MSEHSKKVLWLALAVSLFALVVVAAAFFLFSPGKESSSAPFALNGKTEARQETPSDYLADSPQDSLSTQTTSSGDIIIVYGNDPGSTNTTAAPNAAPSSPTTIVVSPVAKTPSTTLPPATTTTVKPSTPTTVKPVSTTAVAKPAPAAPKASTTPATNAPKASTPPAPVAAKSSSGDYWIQAGSFSVKNNADALKALIEQKKLPVSIQVKEVDGKSRYTVRVGPYPSRTEASKWLSAAKSVKGAEQSWITQ